MMKITSTTHEVIQPTKFAQLWWNTYRNHQMTAKGWEHSPEA